MKKLFILFVLATGSFCANAQTQFGIKGGVNLSTITGDGSEVFTSSIGFHAGGFAKFGIAKQFSIQTEAMLSFEGAKFNVSGVSGNVSVTYLRLPVLAQYHAGSGFVLQSGPQIGLLLGANSKVKNQSTENIKDDLKSTDFSWVFGVGFMPEKGKAGVNLRYNLGLSNINSTAGPANRTSVWQIGTFIMLGK
ncbi:MAG: porin family protein [Sediminibacterium sp.]